MPGLRHPPPFVFDEGTHLLVPRIRTFRENASHDSFRKTPGVVQTA
jgi:hypothetical protein